MKLTLTAGILLFCCTAASADWQPDTSDELQMQAHAAYQRFQDEQGETLKLYFDKAHAYAIFPAVRKGGIVFAYGGGKGIVVENGEFVGYVRQRRFGLGAQIGWQKQSQIIFFRDEKALTAFKEGTLEFTPQASAAAGKRGGSKDGGFNADIAIFSMIEGGLMAEAAASATKYKYRPAE